MAKSAAQLLRNNLPNLRMAFSRATRDEVLVGVPREDKPREDSGPNNATLAYIHDNGAPASGIPARPFMRPGVEAARPRVEAIMKAAARAVLRGHGADPSTALQRAGLITAASIKSIISAGLTPALKPDTIAGRARSRGTKSRRAGEAQYLAATGSGVSAEEAQAAAGIKPLINTGQLRNSITYAVRKKT